MTPEPERRTARWEADGELHLDLRGLTPPQPLVTILRVLRTAPTPPTLVVHLDRDPVLLYPELDAIGWQAEPMPGGDGEVVLRLSPSP